MISKYYIILHARFYSYLYVHDWFESIFSWFLVIHSILSKFGFYQYFSLLLSKLVSQAANSETIMRNINICQVLISHWLPKDDKMLDMMNDFLCFPILKPNPEWPCLAQMQIFVVNMTKNFIRLLMTIPLTYFTSSP